LAEIRVGLVANTKFTFWTARPSVTVREPLVELAASVAERLTESTRLYGIWV
jgi:hypothetical protein